MEQINIGITKEKKEDLRVQIQILESEINELKQSGDKYNILPKKEIYLETLKQEWFKLDAAIGIEYSNTVRESTEQLLQEKEASKEYTYQNVSIDENWALENHYKEMYNLKKNITKIDNEIKKENDFIKKTTLEGQKSKLEEKLYKLESYKKEDIILFAKSKKASYLNAKQRYEKLSNMEKLKIKLQGKFITWDKIKDDPSYTEVNLDTMYQPRSR